MTTGSHALAASLPAVSDHADRIAVIYDGECRFCQGQVARLHRWDWFGRLAFISLHDPAVAQRWPDLSHAALMKEMFIVTPEGDRFSGAGAIRYLSRRLVPLWPACPFLHLPGTLGFWSWAYRQVARRRYQLAGRDSCDNGACEIHFQQPVEQRTAKSSEKSAEKSSEKSSEKSAEKSAEKSSEKSAEKSGSAHP